MQQNNHVQKHSLLFLYAAIILICVFFVLLIWIRIGKHSSVQQNTYNSANPNGSTVIDVVSPKPPNSSPSLTPKIVDNRYPNLDKSEEEFQRENHPDVFLSNYTPYSTSNFSVTYQFQNGQPVGHYFFVVTLLGSDNNASKDALFTWLRSLSLTGSEIQRLDIRYQ